MFYYKIVSPKISLMHYFIIISLGIFRCRNYSLFFNTDQSSDTYVYIYMCVLTSAFYSNSETSTIVNWFCTLCWKSDFTAWWHETNFTGVSITSPTSLSATVCVSQMTSGFCFSLFWKEPAPLSSCDHHRGLLWWPNSLVSSSGGGGLFSGFLMT